MEELKELIAAKLDVLQLLDILELDFEQLLDYLEERIAEYEPELARATR